MSHWVRLWSDMPTDPKWRVIARRAGRPLSEVIAVFVFMMTNAGANATERGELFNWQDDDVAAALDMDTDHVAAIREAMQGKTLDGDKLTGWDNRQPKREDNSAERAKAWRDRKKSVESVQANDERDRTQANAEKRPDADADAELESSNELSPQRAKRAASASEFGQQIGNEFETVFWVEYPARIDRKAAAQKFLIARRKHSLDTIMAGLRSYKAGKPDWQQWKSPAAWLNGEKFLDDHAARAGPEPPPHPHEFERQQQRLREEAARKFGIAQ